MQSMDERLQTNSRILRLPLFPPDCLGQPGISAGLAHRISIARDICCASLAELCFTQVAKQQGEYIAKLLASGKAQPGKPIQGVKPFRYTFMTLPGPSPALYHTDVPAYLVLIETSARCWATHSNM